MKDEDSPSCNIYPTFRFSFSTRRQLIRDLHCNKKRAEAFEDGRNFEYPNDFFSKLEDTLSPFTLGPVDNWVRVGRLEYLEKWWLEKVTLSLGIYTSPYSSF